MGNLTANFSRSEFACKGEDCCEYSAPVSRELVSGLQELSDRLVGYIGYRVPLIVSSGFRCNRHNKNIGGAKNSQHCYGTAADILIPPEITVDKFKIIAEQIDCFKNGGIGVYSSWLHLDVRGSVARWDNR